MAPQKRRSGQSFGESSSSSIKRSTPPSSPTKQRSTERFTLPDGSTAHRVPAPSPSPSHSCHHTILFYDNGNPGVSVKNVLNGECVQDNPELDFKAGFLKIVFQWPGYDSSDVHTSRHITVNPNTRQELAVALCTALHNFYLSVSKISPSVEFGPWALCSRVRLRNIMLMSLHSNAGMWFPEFYVLRR